VNLLSRRCVVEFVLVKHLVQFSGRSYRTTCHPEHRPRVSTWYFGCVPKLLGYEFNEVFPGRRIGSSRNVPCLIPGASLSASSTRLRAASGVKVNECFTESLASQLASAPLADLSNTSNIGDASPGSGAIESAERAIERRADNSGRSRLSAELPRADSRT